MTRIIECEWQNAGSSASRIGFEMEGWSRYLMVDKRGAYFIGGRCNTCEFLFERLEANDKIEIEDTATALRAGVAALSDPVIVRLGSGLPVSEYLTCLVDTDLELVRPSEPRDYFTKEQIAVWGLSGFWGLPHHPKVPVLDVRSPVDWPRPGATQRGEHWCLVHYVLDGHHKLFPASRVGRPLTLLSYIAADEGISRKQIERVASVLAG